MSLEESLKLIAGFNAKSRLLITGVDDSTSRALEAAKGIGFPAELKAYIDATCSLKDLDIQAVGHPVQLISKKNLSWTLPGYSQDPKTQLPLSNWSDRWFLIAKEGGDPIIVDLNDQGSASPVYSAFQGGDNWEFLPIADSIGQFLLCISAIEHALNFPGIAEPLDEDFNLAGPAAAWLFPFLKAHASSHYDEWASVFENYQDPL